MHPFSEAYLNDVVENQGKLFDFIATTFPNKDTEFFIKNYMQSNTRRSIDEGHAYVCTMDYKDLWNYYLKTETPVFLEGKAMKGFIPDWIGEFYAYYQWYYDLPSSTLIQKVPLDFLKKAYSGLHDLELELAVQKVGKL